MSSLRKIIEENGIEAFGRFYGVYHGIVKNDYDPENRGRLYVEIPQVKFKSDLVWADAMAFVSGSNHGSYHIPATNDWVYIQFIEGNPSKPVWLPGGYAKGELPKEFDHNALMGVKSLAGHSVIIDDLRGIIKVSSAAGFTITINDDKEEITISTPAKVGISLSDKDIKIGKGDKAEPAVLGDTLKDLLKELADIFSVESGNLANDVPVPANFVFTPKAIVSFKTWAGKLSGILTKFT